MIELLQELVAWAWARHHNMLSWYIRPLFLLPLAWFAWRRSGWGIAGTLVALVTSMAWFPAPERPDPRVLEFLWFEREYLTGNWTAGKVLLSLVPIALMVAYCLVFWRRSLGWGLVLLNVMALGKLLWGVVLGDGTGWAMTVPLLAGLVVGDVALVLAARHLSRRRADGGELAAALDRSAPRTRRAGSSSRGTWTPACPPPGWPRTRPTARTTASAAGVSSAGSATSSPYPAQMLHVDGRCRARHPARCELPPDRRTPPVVRVWPGVEGLEWSPG